jgi:integrase
MIVNRLQVYKTEPIRANRVLAAASVFLRWAVEAGHRSDNPARGLRRYPEKAREVWLTGEQLAAVEAAIGETVKDPITAAALTFLCRSGWRRNEALRLKWSELDLDHVGADGRPAPRAILGSTKSGGSVRPLAARAADMLRALPRLDPVWCFPSTKGSGPLTSPHKAWCKVRKAAGFPDLRIHDLRHSIGAALVTSGVPLPAVALLLGHKSVASTARYAHAGSAAGASAADALESYLPRTAGAGQRAPVVELRQRRELGGRG